MNRRRFLTGLGIALAAPVIITTPGLLMRVRTPPLSRVTHTVSDRLPMRPGVPGSTWLFRRGTSHADLQANADGLWLPTAPLPGPQSPWAFNDPWDHDEREASRRFYEREEAKHQIAVQRAGYRAGWPHGKWGAAA